MNYLFIQFWVKHFPLYKIEHLYLSVHILWFSFTKILCDWFILIPWTCCFLFKEDDPFWEDPSTEILIGCVHVYLQSLAYMIDMKEKLQITDFKGQNQGKQKKKAYLPLIFCDNNGILPSTILLGFLCVLYSWTGSPFFLLIHLDLLLQNFLSMKSYLSTKLHF